MASATNSSSIDSSVGADSSFSTCSICSSTESSIVSVWLASVSSRLGCSSTSKATWSNSSSHSTISSSDFGEHSSFGISVLKSEFGEFSGWCASSTTFDSSVSSIGTFSSVSASSSTSVVGVNSIGSDSSTSRGKSPFSLVVSFSAATNSVWVILTSASFKVSSLPVFSCPTPASFSSIDWLGSSISSVLFSVV